MREFIDRALNAAGKYTVLDFACLKIAILSIGILLGAYFSEFFLGYTSYLWVIYIVSFAWIIYRTFFKYMK